MDEEVRKGGGYILVIASVFMVSGIIIGLNVGDSDAKFLDFIGIIASVLLTNIVAISICTAMMKFSDRKAKKESSQEKHPL